MNDDLMRFRIQSQFAVAVNKAVEQLTGSLYTPDVSTTASPASELPPLTAKTLMDAVSLLPDPPVQPVIKFIPSKYAVRDTGKKTGRYIKRRWKTRLFSWPWQPWRTHRLILVPIYEPVIYRIGDTVVYHPSYEPALRRAGGV